MEDGIGATVSKKENGVRVICPVCGREVGTWIRELVVTLRNHTAHGHRLCRGAKLEVDPVHPSMWPALDRRRLSDVPALLVDQRGWPWADSFTREDVQDALKRQNESEEAAN